jgi:urease accessory protein
LAEAVGADLNVMEADARRMRGQGPIVMAQINIDHPIDQIVEKVLASWQQHTTPSSS